MRTVLICMTVTLTGLLGLTTPAHAGSAAVASGSFTFTPITFTQLKAAGGNATFYIVATVGYSGGLSGDAADTEWITVHRDGTYNWHGFETCDDCALGSASGSYTAIFEGVGSDFYGYEVPFHGTLTFTSGSGGLAGLHGHGTFAGTLTSQGYSYAYGFGT